jgi:formyltetrahydrofolate hydrolase
MNTTVISNHINLKSAVAEHRIDLGHCILLDKTKILANKSIIREIKELKLHPNMNRND